jgi:hypothetical protein
MQEAHDHVGIDAGCHGAGGGDECGVCHGWLGRIDVKRNVALNGRKEIVRRDIDKV